MKKFMKIGIIILIIAFILNVCVIVKAIKIVNNHKDFKVINCEKVYYSCPKSPQEIDKKEVYNIINNHFNMIYLVKEDDCISKGKYGYCYPIIRYIHIDSTINCWTMIYTLVHELCHIKYQSVNETYVTYMSFLELQKSNNEYMKYVYELLIYEQCTLKIYKNTEYDIAYYIHQNLANNIIFE